MFYIFLRVFLIPLLLIGYIFFQLLFKQKKLSELKNDVLYVVVFTIIILLIYFLA